MLYKRLNLYIKYKYKRLNINICLKYKHKRLNINIYIEKNVLHKRLINSKCLLQIEMFEIKNINKKFEIQIFFK